MYLLQWTYKGDQQIQVPNMFCIRLEYFILFTPLKESWLKTKGTCVSHNQMNYFIALFILLESSDSMKKIYSTDASLLHPPFRGKNQ